MIDSEFIESKSELIEEKHPKKKKKYMLSTNYEDLSPKNGTKMFYSHDKSKNKRSNIPSLSIN